ncbi:MAG TPA: hypothetical protein VK906_10665 [Egicoccus sp.]|nr:hypothetical protein [Egicoccus sp.]HSK23631.1 hypothetical protein [Egicoccus sp.]
MVSYRPRDARRPASPRVAGEHAGRYRTARDEVARRRVEREREEFGDGLSLEHPVLDDVPLLGHLLASLNQIDRIIASAVDTIIQLQESGAVEATTGVWLEQWLAIVCRRTRTDRRMLLTTAEVCRRLPSLREGFSQGRISWCQARNLVCQVMKLPRVADDELDAGIAALIDRADGADPDTLGDLARWLVEDHAPDPGDDPDADVAEYLALQPRLDGTGGRFHGEVGAVRFAQLAEATDPGPADEPARKGFGATSDPDAARRIARSAGRRRLDRLFDLLDHATAADDGDRPGQAPVSLLLRADLDSLLDRHQTPAALLTKLTGGRMRLSSAAARRLIDERGADLRTVVLDDTGSVLGVGRRTNLPPGWLRDAILAIHDVCTEPGCLTAARACDTDHAQPWHPVRPGDVGGRTDIDNTAPLCRPANRTKEADGWTCTQTADGTRTWRHQRTNLSVKTISTTRPPGAAPARSGTDPPAAGTDPPGDPPGDPP